MNYLIWTWVSHIKIQNSKELHSIKQHLQHFWKWHKSYVPLLHTPSCTHTHVLNEVWVTVLISDLPVKFPSCEWCSFKINYPNQSFFTGSCCIATHADCINLKPAMNMYYVFVQGWHCSHSCHTSSVYYQYFLKHYKCKSF